MTRPYAKGTNVPVSQTQCEIEATLRRYGAQQFISGWDQSRAVIGFTVLGESGQPRQVRLFLPSRWLVKRGYFSESPFGSVEKIGKADRGKSQLTVDESRILVGHCLTIPEDPGALAVLVAIGLGLRSGEVRGLEARDIDNAGTELVVRCEVSKSKDERRLVIPAWLQGIVTKEKFPITVTSKRSSKRPPMTASSFLSRTKTLCKHAGVSEVGPQGLRGTHSTLATSAGAASEYVAASLGHTGPATTERHCIADGAIESGGAQRAALKLVRGGTLCPANDVVDWAPKTQ